MKTKPYDPEADRPAVPAVRAVDPPGRVGEDGPRNPLAGVPTGELAIIILPSVTAARLAAAAEALHMTVAQWLDEAVTAKLKAQEP